MKLLKFTFVLAAMLFGADSARAQHWGGSEKREQMVKNWEARVEQIYDQLNLSQEQRKLIRENRARHKDAMEALGQKRKDSMKMIGEELKQKDPDLDKLSDLYAGVKNLGEEATNERFRSILEVRKILTQEQFIKFNDLIEEQKRRRNQ